MILIVIITENMERFHNSNANSNNHYGLHNSVMICGRLLMVFFLLLSCPPRLSQFSQCLTIDKDFFMAE